mmetsp:Transcript_37454/g.60141  ORF Transcript_37454/g.60141 Transcript_37454/m.60141 type:complete len:80 (+) Transcript_37454:60-299(+)
MWTRIMEMMADVEDDNNNNNNSNDHRKNNSNNPDIFLDLHRCRAIRIIIEFGVVAAAVRSSPATSIALTITALAAVAVM